MSAISSSSGPDFLQFIYDRLTHHLGDKPEMEHMRRLHHLITKMREVEQELPKLQALHEDLSTTIRVAKAPLGESDR